jgi:mersacidin/lichenicidin family type 2 lantibiotic
MSKIDVIRAWKDEDYRSRLTPDQIAQLPTNPVGLIDLSDSELEVVVGASTEHIQTLGCCGGLTSDPGFCSWICDTGGTGNTCAYTNCKNTTICCHQTAYADEELLF